MQGTEESDGFRGEDLGLKLLRGRRGQRRERDAAGGGRCWHGGLGLKRQITSDELSMVVNLNGFDELTFDKEVGGVKLLSCIGSPYLVV